MADHITVCICTYRRNLMLARLLRNLALQRTDGYWWFTLEANESIYIPVEEKHRLENRGDAPLELIEVQSGEYLGEDDIVRFEDHYGRL